MKHHRDPDSRNADAVTSNEAERLPETVARYGALLAELRVQLAGEVALRESIHATLDSSILRQTRLLEQLQAGEDRNQVQEAQLERFRGDHVCESRERLSLREVEVLRSVALSKSNKETGRELGISFKTVEKHRQALMDKLDIHDLAGLTRFAITAGFILLPRMER